jgi:addiction module HigA family antidote
MGAPLRDREGRRNGGASASARVGEIEGAFGDGGELRGSSSGIRTHSGEVLPEESCKPLDLSANALALALRVPATRIGHILRTEKPCAVSADTAIRLARYFGTIPEFSLRDLHPREELAA